MGALRKPNMENNPPPAEREVDYSETEKAKIFVGNIARLLKLDSGSKW